MPLIRVPTNFADLIDVLTASGHLEIVPYSREENREGEKIQPKTKSGRKYSGCLQASLIGVILLATLLFYVGSFVARTVEVACSGWLGARIPFCLQIDSFSTSLRTPLTTELEIALSLIVEEPVIHSRPVKLSSSPISAGIERGYEELLSASRIIGPRMPYLTSDGCRGSQMVSDSLELSAIVSEFALNLTEEIFIQSNTFLALYDSINTLDNVNSNTAVAQRISMFNNLTRHCSCSLDLLIDSAKSVGTNIQTITQMSIQGAQLMFIEKEAQTRVYDRSASSFWSKLGWNSAEQESLKQFINVLDAIISRQGAASLLFSRAHKDLSEILSRLMSVREKMDVSAALGYDAALWKEDQWFGVRGLQDVVAGYDQAGEDFLIDATAPILIT